MKDYFIFGSVSSADFFVYLYDFPLYETPEKRINKQTIPGKSGDLIIDDSGAFENRSAVCKCYETKSMEFVKQMRADLLRFSTYQRLENTREPEYYRMALCKSVKPDTIGSRSRQGTIEIEFDCKPQCWLKSGELPIVLTANAEIHNPTLYEAKPLIRVYGTGELGIGSKTVRIIKADGYTDLDCEIEEAFKDDASVNCNGNVEITDFDFPTLPAGDTGIRLGSGISRVEIIPRWWTL